MSEDNEHVSQDLEELGFHELVSEWERAMLTGLRLILNEQLVGKHELKNIKS